jgi:hypothetical protein
MMAEYTFVQLRERLEQSMLFDGDDIDRIMDQIGKATMGNVIAACQHLGIDLSSDDIDDLIDD